MACRRSSDAAATEDFSEEAAEEQDEEPAMDSWGPLSA